MFPDTMKSTKTFNRLAITDPVFRENASRRLGELRRSTPTEQYQVSPYLVSDEFYPRTIRVGGIYDLLWRIGKFFRDQATPARRTYDFVYIYKV